MPRYAVAFFLALAFSGACAGELAEGTRPGETVTLKLPDGTAMDFCWCPAGSFAMGSTPVDTPKKKVRDIGTMQVEVKLTHGFWLARAPCTQAQWQALMGTTLQQQAELQLLDTPLDHNFGGELRAEDCGPDKPMTLVRQGEAAAYCDKLGSALHLPKPWCAALPTEAQWEYALRAGAASRYPFGDGTDPAAVAAFLGPEPTTDTRVQETHTTSDTGKVVAHGTIITAIQRPAGTRLPNAWGLLDMQGAIGQWCADWYDVWLTGGTDPAGPPDGFLRVVRGSGRWGRQVQWYHCGYRSESQALSPPRRHLDVGFRPALILPVTPGSDGLAPLPLPTAEEVPVPPDHLDKPDFAKELAEPARARIMEQLHAGEQAAHDPGAAAAHYRQAMDLWEVSGDVLSPCATALRLRLARCLAMQAAAKPGPGPALDAALHELRLTLALRETLLPAPDLIHKITGLPSSFSLVRKPEAKSGTKAEAKPGTKAEAKAEPETRSKFSVKSETKLAAKDNAPAAADTGPRDDETDIAVCQLLAATLACSVTGTPAAEDKAPLLAEALVFAHRALRSSASARNGKPVLTKAPFVEDPGIVRAERLLFALQQARHALPAGRELAPTVTRLQLVQDFPPPLSFLSQAQRAKYRAAARTRLDQAAHDTCAALRLTTPGTRPEAVPLLVRALKTEREILGPDHPLCTRTRLLLDCIDVTFKTIPDTIKRLRDDLPAAARLLPKDDAHLAWARRNLQNLLATYTTGGQDEQSALGYAILASLPPAKKDAVLEDSVVLQGIAGIMGHLQGSKQAVETVAWERLCRDLARLVTHFYGPGSLPAVDCQRVLSGQLLWVGKVAEAAREGLAAVELGDNVAFGPETNRSLANLAVALNLDGHPAQALAFARRIALAGRTPDWWMLQDPAFTPDALVEALARRVAAIAGTAPAIPSMLTPPSRPGDEDVVRFPEIDGQPRREYAYLGDPESLYFLGRGWAGPWAGQQRQHNAGVVFRWVELAARHGCLHARNELGRYLVYGFYTDQPDPARGVALLRAAADSGDAEAMYDLAELHSEGKGLKKDEPETLRLLAQAANQGFPPAIRLLALKCAGEKPAPGSTPSLAAALQWWQLGTRLDDAECEHRLGRFYLFGDGVKQDVPRALELLRSAAEQGYVDAQYLLGHTYNVPSRRLDLHRDATQALYWLTLAANHGSREALNELTHPAEAVAALPRLPAIVQRAAAFKPRARHADSLPPVSPPPK